MVRVLQVVGKMHYGGMETLIMNIYRNIDRNRVQFDFLVHYQDRGEYDAEIEQLGGNIFIMPNPTPSNYFSLKRTYKEFFISHKEYRYVHVHLHNLAFLIFPIAKKCRMQCILHIHNAEVEHNIKGYLGLITTRLAIPRANTIFVCSKESANYYIKSLKKYEIIKNGICADKFYYNIDVRNKIREELALKDKFVLLCTARFAIQKNHEFLLDIVNELKKIDSNICLLLVGKGPLENNIRLKVKQFALQKEVMFLGARGDVNELMQAADCFVMPSFSEGLGIVYIEAQAAGLRTYAAREALVREACVTNLIEGIPLSMCANKWAEKIYEQREYKRENQKELIEKSGFDICTTVEYLEEFYQSK